MIEQELTQEKLLDLHPRYAKKTRHKNFQAKKNLKLNFLQPIPPATSQSNKNN